MEHSFRIDNILPDLRAAMSNQSCYFEGRKPAEMGGFLENKPILTPESPEEEEKKCVESPNQDMNCRKRISSAASDITTSNGEEEEGFNRKKKARTAFSREQVMELEKKFQEKKYLSSSERGELAEKLKLSDMQVKTWFQNRRMKLKRQVEEAEMELKSPKYPFGPLMPFSGMSPPFYGYNMNMMSSYKPDCFSFPYPSRPPATSLAGGERDFPGLALPSPPYPTVPNSNFYSSVPRRPPPPQPHRNGFFPANGAPFTPLSPSSMSQPCHLSGDTYNPISNTVQPYANPPPSTTPFTADWQRAIPTPPTP